MKTDYKISSIEILSLKKVKSFNLNEDIYFENVSIDSRKLTPNSLFVAVKGENFDGHDFLSSAVNNGATGLIVNKNFVEEATKFGVPVFAVKDTLKAFGELAAIYRSKLKAKVIGITGSNGKTTTKDILSSLLANSGKVVHTEANNNNHIGVPLTIFNAGLDTDYLVLELGTNHFGEISYTAKIAQPDLGLITLIGDSHLEYLKNRRGVLKEKRALLDVTAKRNGIVFINSEDILLSQIKDEFKKSVTFGFDEVSDVKARFLRLDAQARCLIKIESSKFKFECTLPLLGEDNAKNFLAAIAVLTKCGIKKEDVISSVSKLKPPKGRLNLSVRGTTAIIDDTYNANPNSMKSAIKVINAFELFNHKIAVLGDMFELGNEAEKAHKKLAKSLLKTNLELVLLIGEKMKLLYQELKPTKIKVVYFGERESLCLFLKELSTDNSVFLFKGSRGMKMEQFIPCLIVREN